MSMALSGIGSGNLFVCWKEWVTKAIEYRWEQNSQILDRKICFSLSLSNEVDFSLGDF